MEAENIGVNKEKIVETVQKYVELIHQNKVYQFTQKIQLLTHRKEQSKKYQQAEFLLVCAIQKLLANTSQDKNQPYTLLDHLLKLYETHPETWNLQKGKKIYELLNIRKNDKKYQYYLRFLKALKNKPFPKDLLLDLINFYINREEFTKAQSHVLQLELSFVKNFFQKWSSKVSVQEATAIKCRLALLRGLFSNFQECQQLLQGVDEKNPFFKFSKFLITCSKLKSKEAYDLIGSRYKQFLQKDDIYNKIYLGYGSYFFKIDNSGKGSSLLSLFK